MLDQLRCRHPRPATLHRHQQVARVGLKLRARQQLRCVLANQGTHADRSVGCRATTAAEGGHHTKPVSTSATADFGTPAAASAPRRLGRRADRRVG